MIVKPIMTVVGVAIAALLVGCSAPQLTPDLKATAGPTVLTPDLKATAGPTVVHGSMVTHYENSAQLAGDATLLVVGEVINSTPVQISNLTFTKYTIKVDQVVAGKAEGELSVYAVGEPGWNLSVDVPEYFELGERYALFLRPTTLPRGTPGGDGYYIVGLGAWVESNDSAFRIWLDPAKDVDLARIPTTFAAADIAEALSAGQVGSAR